MVQFVKPNLLGKYNEYLNRFVNPITNGQYVDSTPKDIQMMKRRSHILHKLLDGCVQRRDYAVLAPYLPVKHEYVVYIQLTKLQIQLYNVSSIKSMSILHIVYLYVLYHNLKLLELFIITHLIKHFIWYQYHNINQILFYCFSITWQINQIQIHLNLPDLLCSFRIFKIYSGFGLIQWYYDTTVIDLRLPPRKRLYNMGP